MSDITKDQVVEWLSNQSVIEIAGLVKVLETKWGVSAAAPVAAAAAPAAGATATAPAAAAEEKTEFTVVLKESGANKIGVIKEVRAVTNLGLKEGVSKADAEDIKKKLAAAGATVEIK